MLSRVQLRPFLLPLTHPLQYRRPASYMYDACLRSVSSDASHFEQYVHCLRTWYVYGLTSTDPECEATFDAAVNQPEHGSLSKCELCSAGGSHQGSTGQRDRSDARQLAGWSSRLNGAAPLPRLEDQRSSGARTKGLGLNTDGLVCTRQSSGSWDRVVG
jgi:hypothetical protein